MDLNTKIEEWGSRTDFSSNMHHYLRILKTRGDILITILQKSAFLMGGVSFMARVQTPFLFAAK